MTAQWVAPAGFAAVVAGVIMIARWRTTGKPWFYWAGMAVMAAGTAAILLAPLP